MRITDFTELTIPTSNDLLVVVDVVNDITKKLKLSSLPISTAVTTALATKQDTLVSGTNIKTVNSTSLVGSGNVAVQETLVSGTNIKTLNSTSLLGSGNIVLTANPSGVAGAIQFSNGSEFASDAANLFWDDTNNRLGVGTNVPVKTLNVVGGDVQIGNSLTSGNFNPATYRTFTIGSDYGSGALQIGNGTTGLMWGGLYANISNVAVYANSRDLTFETPVEAMRITSGRNVGIGETTPTSRLHIKGSGSTSATTSLLVQNSAGTPAFQIKDDRTIDTFANTIGNQTWGQTIVGLGASGEMRLQSGGGAGFFMTFHTCGSEAMRIDAQRNVGINTLAANNTSAILQIDSTTKGFLPPRMTTTQKNAIASPASGLTVYDTTTNKLCCYNGSTWNDLF